MKEAPVNILLVEDDPTYAFLVRQYLEQPEWYPFRMACAATLADGLDNLRAGTTQLVILDLGLPDSDGLATLECVQKHAPELPVVVLTGALDEDLGMDAVALGAQDFLSKEELDPALLVRSVRFALRRKRLEDELRALNASLERRVAERTAELAAANEQLGSFAYTVSHDLRAPVRQMRTFAELLHQRYASVLGEGGEADLRLIRELAGKMMRMIDALYDLSQVGAGELVKEDLDLSSLAAETVAELRSGDADREVQVAIEPGVTGRGDRELLLTVLRNLIGNAWKFVESTEKARIGFGVERSAGGPAYCVRDNGPGFDSTLSNRLFEPFQRLPDAKDIEGSGIGLATVRRIIQLHGGQVWASARPGQGAAFYFTLP